MAKKACGLCGAVILPRARFCYGCGEAIPGAPAVASGGGPGWWGRQETITKAIVGVLSVVALFLVALAIVLGVTSTGSVDEGPPTATATGDSLSADSTSPVDTTFPAETMTSTGATTATTQDPGLYATYTGDKSEIVEMGAHQGPVLLHITSSNPAGEFGMECFDAAGENTTLDMSFVDSAYDGFVLLDWMAWMGYVTDRIQVNAHAPWSIEVLPPTAAKRLAPSGTLEGRGDDVVFLTGSPSSVRITTAADNESIYVQYTDASGEEWDYLEAEPGGVESLSVVPGDGYLLINSRGGWSISSQD